MKTLIIQPTAYSYKTGKLIKKKNKKGLCPSFILPYLASFMPEDFDVEIVDETINDINFNNKYDLVCITVKTPIAFRAYEISRKFRDKNIPVIMGGYHVNLLPEEAQKFADSIVLGEIECTWNEILKDLDKGGLKSIYRAKSRFDMKGMNIPRYDLIEWSKYSAFFGLKIPVESSRGCNRSCSFCSTSQVYKGGIRFRPIEEVVREIEIIKNKLRKKRLIFKFIDDNLTSDKNRAYELFEKLIDLNIRWCGYFTTTAAVDSELMNLASKAGCFNIFVGFESINKESLKAANKTFNIKEKYDRCLQNCNKNNIVLEAGIIFGFLSDTFSIVKDTTRFLIRHKIPVIIQSPLYPFPGTPLYDVFYEGGYIKNKDFWLKKHNPFNIINHPNFEGKISLEKAFQHSYNELMKFSSIMRRSMGCKKYAPFIAIFNLHIRKIMNKEGISAFV
jgi:radical SAM superfamily enzyme YgiQ (UPF0313 family)